MRWLPAPLAPGISAVLNAAPVFARDFSRSNRSHCQPQTLLLLRLFAVITPSTAATAAAASATFVTLPPFPHGLLLPNSNAATILLSVPHNHHCYDSHCLPLLLPSSDISETCISPEKLQQVPMDHLQCRTGYALIAPMGAGEQHRPVIALAAAHPLRSGYPSTILYRPSVRDGRYGDQHLSRAPGKAAVHVYAHVQQILMQANSPTSNVVQAGRVLQAPHSRKIWDLLRPGAFPSCCIVMCMFSRAARPCICFLEGFLLQHTCCRTDTHLLLRESERGEGWMPGGVGALISSWQGRQRRWAWRPGPQFTRGMGCGPASACEKCRPGSSLGTGLLCLSLL